VVGCYIWYSEEGPGRAAAPPSPFIAVPNVTAPAAINGQCTNHCSAVYDGPLLCSFNVAIKGLIVQLKEAQWKHSLINLTPHESVI